MNRRSGNPARSAWDPMRCTGSTTEVEHVDQLMGARYAYRMEAERVSIEAWENRLYNGWLTWFEDGSGHFTFKRQDRTPVRDWRHIQAIKNEIAGPEREAVEVYPAETKLVDGANEYHLWILPKGAFVPMGFVQRAVGQAPDTYDRPSQLQGNRSPGGRQRSWEEGLPTGQGDPGMLRHLLSEAMQLVADEWPDSMKSNPETDVGKLCAAVEMMGVHVPEARVI